MCTCASHRLEVEGGGTQRGMEGSPPPGGTYQQEKTTRRSEWSTAPLCDEVPRAALGPHSGWPGMWEMWASQHQALGSWGSHSVIPAERPGHAKLSLRLCVKWRGSEDCGLSEMLQSRCQHRARGSRLWVGTDLSVCEPSPLELSCLYSPLRSSQPYCSDLVQDTSYNRPGLLMPGRAVLRS